MLSVQTTAEPTKGAQMDRDHLDLLADALFTVDELLQDDRVPIV